jgi:hypothetical protein
MWRKDKHWIFGYKSEEELVPYAVADNAADMVHLTRDFTIDGKACKIFSYAIKSALPLATAASSTGSTTGSAPGSLAGDDEESDPNVLRVNTRIALSFSRNDRNEGFWNASIRQLQGDKFKIECHKRDGQLDGSGSRLLSRADAVIYRKALLDELPIPQPHDGLYSCVKVKCSGKAEKILVGTYKYTTLRQGGMPVYMKVGAKKSSPVTCTWRSPSGKWIYGIADEMYTNPESGFAVAKEASVMPHFTHKYYVQKKETNVIAYSIKAAEGEDIPVFCTDDEGSDGEGGESDQGSDQGSDGEGPSSGKRSRFATDRFKTDEANAASMARTQERNEQKRRKGSEGGAGGAAGGGAPRGAGGAAGGASSRFTAMR